MEVKSEAKRLDSIEELRLTVIEQGAYAEVLITIGFTVL